MIPCGYGCSDNSLCQVTVPLFIVWLLLTAVSFSQHRPARRSENIWVLMEMCTVATPPDPHPTWSFWRLYLQTTNNGWKSDGLLSLTRDCSLLSAIAIFFLLSLHISYPRTWQKGGILTRRGASTGMPARCWERGPDVITSNRFCSLICNRMKHRDISHQWLPCDSK